MDKKDLKFQFFMHVNAFFIDKNISITDVLSLMYDVEYCVMMSAVKNAEAGMRKTIFERMCKSSIDLWTDVLTSYEEIMTEIADGEKHE